MINLITSLLIFSFCADLLEPVGDQTKLVTSGLGVDVLLSEIVSSGELKVRTFDITKKTINYFSFTVDDQNRHERLHLPVNSPQLAYVEFSQDGKALLRGRIEGRGQLYLGASPTSFSSEIAPRFARGMNYPIIQADHPEIKRLATTITKNISSERAKAQELFRWVYSQIGTDFQRAYSDADRSVVRTNLETIKAGSGVCRDFAALLVALLRSVNLPARIAVGAMGSKVMPDRDNCKRSETRDHAWVEAYIEGTWISIDPSRATSDPGQGIEHKEKYFDMEKNSQDPRFRLRYPKYLRCDYLPV